MENSNKVFWKSKELWVVFLALLNLGLNKFGLPSFEASEEFWAAIMFVIGVLRSYSTSARLTLTQG